MSQRVLAINPGGGSTRLAVYDDHRQLHRAELRHDQGPLEGAATDFEDQLSLHLEPVRRQLGAWGVEQRSLAAVVGRGGPYRPLRGGVYAVNRALLADVRAGRLMADHPSKLGAELAWRLAGPARAPAFVVDPVSVDELAPWARLTGLPELSRVSLFHALNIKAVARRHARERKSPLEELVLIVAHMGSGTSVALLEDGRAVDVNNSADEGPFASRRAGGLPSSGLLALASQPGFDALALARRAMSGGGLLAHLGSADLAAAEQRAADGEHQAALVLDAMAYGVAKAIGAMAAVAGGRVDGILLTGGMAHCEPWLARLEPRVTWIAPVVRFPGEDELRALVEGAMAALTGDQPVLDYPSGNPLPAPMRR